MTNEEERINYKCTFPEDQEQNCSNVFCLDWEGKPNCRYLVEDKN